MFSKDLHCRHVKPGLVWERVKGLRYESFENTVEKEKLLTTSNFSLFHGVFYPMGELSNIYQIQIGHLQTLTVWKSLKLRKGLKNPPVQCQWLKITQADFIWINDNGWV